MPAYVPCICVMRSSISKVPEAVALHEPFIIIEPAGIVMVKVPLWPATIPDTFVMPPP